MAQDSTKEKPLKIGMSLVILGMIAFMAWMWISNYKTLTEVARVSDRVSERQASNFRYYVNEYKVTKNELEVTTNKLVEVTQELEATNLELNNTRGELVQIQQVNDQLKNNIQALERYKGAAMAKGEALESMIGAFKKKNREIDHELQSVRKELAVFQPDIDSLNQGRDKVMLFKKHIKMVKLNMHAIKKSAYLAKVAAQQERDRVEMLYGNNGYLMKNGKVNSGLSFDQKKVDINVKFVNP
ncbi:MAG: hypothetical protein HGA80_00525 [Candidatus Omnitrophica bacterium]|nr:hypothetical protein [Candidatus Omnitrophota bacterium]